MVIHIILVKVSVLNQALTTSHGIMKRARYYCEVLRQCFGEYLGQSRIAIAVLRGQKSRHETTTFLSPSDSIDLDLENEKPFTKKIFEPLMRIIELLKKGKDKPLLRIIEPLQRIFEPVVDRVRSMVCKAVYRITEMFFMVIYQTKKEHIIFFQSQSVFVRLHWIPKMW